MGLSWQQGPLAPSAVGRFLVAEPLPERLLFAEPLRRRMRVRSGGEWIADSEDVVLLHEPGRYPVAYFPLGDVVHGVLRQLETVTEHRDLGATSWFAVAAGGETKQRAAWQHTGLPAHAAELEGRVAFACAPWTRSTRRTSASSVTPPTPTTATTSAAPPVTWWSGSATGW